VGLPGGVGKVSAKAEKRRTVEATQFSEADVELRSALRSLEVGSHGA